MKPLNDFGNCGSLCLTVIVNRKRRVGRDDVIEADLAVLWRTVRVQGLHPDDAVEQTPLRHGRLVPLLHKHRGELVYIIDTHVNSGSEWEKEGNHA